MFYRLTMGVQNQNLCDYYIRFFLTSPIKSCSQLFWTYFACRIPAGVSDQIPGRAVNEGVAGQKHSNKAASGLVNAVLGRVAESSQNLPLRERIIEVLSIKYSHPPELSILYPAWDRTAQRLFRRPIRFHPCIRINEPRQRLKTRESPAVWN